MEFKEPRTMAKKPRKLATRYPTIGSPPKKRSKRLLGPLSDDYEANMRMVKRPPTVEEVQKARRDARTKPIKF